MKKWLFAITIICAIFSGCSKNNAVSNGPTIENVFYKGNKYIFYVSPYRPVSNIGERLGTLDKKVDGKEYEVFEITGADPNQKVAIKEKSASSSQYYEIDRNG